MSQKILLNNESNQQSIVVRVPVLVGGGCAAQLVLRFFLVFSQNFPGVFLLSSLDLVFPLARQEHHFLSPCNTNLFWVGKWPPCAACSE